jgi:hypothetical protein
MPDLRAREQNLRAQLDALDAQAADRDAYLKLADASKASSPNCAPAPPPASKNASASCGLLVKDVLIGPEKITIRHRILDHHQARHCAGPSRPIPQIEHAGQQAHEAIATGRTSSRKS